MEHYNVAATQITGKKIKFFQEHIIEWELENGPSFPWRKTKNKWHALVAEIMLQRTKAEQVVPVFIEFTKKYQSPEDFMNHGEAGVFKTLGLAWREKLLRELAEILVGNAIPEEKRDLMVLPSVGDYIASAMRSFHFNLRDSIIDSNVVRLYGRFIGFKTGPETRRKPFFKELAEKMTPWEDFKTYNYGLIDLARQICKKKPVCDICPVSSQCVKNLTTSL
ncbi:MAG: hypothetical protein ACFFCS_20330 [Candidatus Hodarchaeota archaeon]